MRKVHFVIAAVIATGLSGTAAAQSSQSAQTSPPAPAACCAEGANHWFVSGYLGPNFGGSSSTFTFNNTTHDIASRSGINYGAEIGYAWAGIIGAEFLFNYAPAFALNSVLLQEPPSASSYMGNVLAAIPIGEGHRVQPFVSGGIGAVAVHSTVFTIDPGTPGVNPATLSTAQENGSRFGWNLGGGGMVFNGAWGLRADVRYFKTTTNNNITDTTVSGIFLQNALSGLSYWTGDFGVVFRW